MRQIIFDATFDAAVERLGGYILVDEALDPILDGLYPYGFPIWVRFRFVVTRAVRFLPSLVVIFTIETNGDVILRHVEEFES